MKVIVTYPCKIKLEAKGVSFKDSFKLHFASIDLKTCTYDPAIWRQNFGTMQVQYQSGVTIHHVGGWMVTVIAKVNSRKQNSDLKNEI